MNERNLEWQAYVDTLVQDPEASFESLEKRAAGLRRRRRLTTAVAAGFVLSFVALGSSMLGHSIEEQPQVASDPQQSPGPRSADLESATVYTADELVTRADRLFSDVRELDDPEVPYPSEITAMPDRTGLIVRVPESVIESADRERLAERYAKIADMPVKIGVAERAVSGRAEIGSR